MSKFFYTLFLIIALVGCGKPEQLSEAAFVLQQPVPASQYKSTLTLHKNGTYIQVVEDKSGTTYSREGRWRQEHRSIQFDRFLFLVDLMEDRWSEKPIEVFAAYAILDGQYLVVRENTGFIYIRNIK